MRSETECQVGHRRGHRHDNHGGSIGESRGKDPWG